MIDPNNPDFENIPGSPQRASFDYALANKALSPYVTIITPFHETGSVFHETASSVLKQSFQQWEWLIIDDGSKDSEALAILKTYRNKDPRIQVIGNGTNKGSSAARNTGYKMARSQYVVQLDSDDLLEPTAIEKWLWYLESYPEFSFCKGYSIGFGAENYLWQKGFHNGRAFLNENLVDLTSMVRKKVHEAVGGYDEKVYAGLEDWEFWLRCASRGYWGHTIPEYLNWYRRRPRHNDRWSDFDNGKRQWAYGEYLRAKYSELFNGGFPDIQPRCHMPNEIVPHELPFENPLNKKKTRLLMIIPWMVMGGADQFNLNLVQQLTSKGLEVTICTTLKADHSWFPEFTRYTPDIFILNHFLRLIDYPRFLRYLINSRKIDLVLISNSELGYLCLPYLRAHFPNVTFVDFCHMEEEHWKNGGYPRMSLNYQELIDLTIVSSQHLKNWMEHRSADPKRIKTCHTNVDTEKWRPESEKRSMVRQDLQMDNTVPLILYAGRICPQKQPRVFAKTIHQLRQQEIKFVALVAGDGEDLKWLRSFVNDNDLNDYVRLMGAVSNQRINDLMVAADVFFLPSQWEGIALTNYEAMACGLAIVGADVGGQRELVTADCGILISKSNEKSDAQQYTRALAELLGNANLLKQMGESGRKRVSKHFKLDKMCEQMIALFDEGKRLHQSCPRDPLSPILARNFANQAIEYIRLYQLSGWLWNEYYIPVKNGDEVRHGKLRLQIYESIYRFYDPFYRWSLAHGWNWVEWLDPVGAKVKGFLLRS